MFGFIRRLLNGRPKGAPGTRDAREAARPPAPAERPFGRAAPRPPQAGAEPPRREPPDAPPPARAEPGVAASEPRAPNASASPWSRPAADPSAHVSPANDAAVRTAKAASARVAAAKPTALEVARAVSLRVGSPYAMGLGRSRPANGPRAPDALWVGLGRSADVQGFRIPGPVYVGTFMPADPAGGYAGDECAPCVVNPKLRAAPGSRGTAFPEVGYWPSYSEIAPECRHAYLRWLSEGRPAGGVGIGYVFLFFYGLERRLLVDRPPPDERHALMEEIARLRRDHDNHSLQSYSRGLLEVLEAVELLAEPEELLRWRPAATAPRGFSLPLRLAIACRVVAGEPLPFDLALPGILSMFGGRLRMGATRAPEEFAALMRHRFDAAFPKGFRLADIRNSTMWLGYNPAARHLELHLAVAPGVGRLPDPQALTWTRLEKLADRAMEDLAPYAKAIGPNRSKAGSLEALALLPKEIAHHDPGGARASLAVWLGELPRPIARVSFAELAERCGSKGAAFSAKGFAPMAEALERFGYGLEPDPRYCRIPARADLAVRLFPVDPDRPRDAGAAAAYTRALAAATALAAAAGPETGMLGEGWVAAFAPRLGFGEAEAVRLAAHWGWLCDRRPGAAEAKRLAGEIAAPGRSALAAALATAVLAGGADRARSLPLLEKAHDLLGVDRAALYRAAHEAAAAGSATPPARGPVAVAFADPAPDASGHRIPRQPSGASKEKPAGRTGGLDLARVRRIQEETREVASALAEIYREDEEPAPSPAAARPMVAGGRFAGLDAEHARLAEALCARAEWPRAEWEDEARRHGLMPDGALETINEWAFDALGGPLAEDGDPIAVDTALLPPAQSEER